MVVMISRVYSYPQTHHIVCLIYVELFTCQSYLSKVAQKINAPPNKFIVLVYHGI